MKNMKFLAMFAFAALAFVGCSDDDDPADAAATKLALADPAQAQLTFAAAAEEGEGAPEAQIIVLDTDAKSIAVEQVLESEEAAADWCVVKVEKTSVRVAPAVNTSDAERTAKYRIVADKLQPVEFTVTQLAAGATPPQQDELSIPKELEMIVGVGEYASYSIPITTTAESWTATLEPDESNPYAFMLDYGTDPVTGASGDELEITFNPNTTSSPLYATVTITAGTAEPIQVTLIQSPKSEEYATSVEVAREGDDSSDWEPIPVSSPHTINFEATDGVRNAQTFEITAEGKYDLKVVEPDTETELAESWLSRGSEAGVNWPIAVTENSGAERKLDIIITGADGVVLFRMHVIQAGAAAAE